MNKQNQSHSKYAAGGTLIAGLLGGSAAHAQDVTTTFNPADTTVTTPTYLYFDVDDSQTSTSDTSLEFEIETNESFPLSAKVSTDNSLVSGVTTPLNPGDTVGSTTTFSASTKFNNGTNDIGFYLTAPMSLTPNYGYFEIYQTSTSDGAVPIPTITYTDTLVKTVYDSTAGQSVTVTPEPGTTSLLLAGAAGAAGLLAWRRRGAALQA